MAMFEVGKSYEAADPGLDLITVTKRTDKFVFVDNGHGSKWKMRLRHDDRGDEMLVDSSAPSKWRRDYTYNARWEA